MFHHFMLQKKLSVVQTICLGSLIFLICLGVCNQISFQKNSELFVSYSFQCCQSERPSTKIAIVFRSGLGDKASALAFSQAATHLGWSSIVIGNVPDTRDLKNSSPISRSKVFQKIQDYVQLIEEFDPDWVLMFHDVAFHPHHIPSVLLLSNPYFFEKKELDFSIYPHFYRHDALLLASDESHFQKIIDRYPQYRERISCGFHLAPVLSTDSSKNWRQRLRQCFFCGDLWDSLRKSDDYKALYRTLDQNQKWHVYGPSQTWKEYPQSYQGFISNGYPIFLETMSQYQVALILHSDIHLKNNVPSARIFEAAEANMLMISDDMPVIREIFGDSVYYLDRSRTLSEQVIERLEWAQQYPQEAEEQALRAHLILRSQWTAEFQLSALHRKYFSSY